MVGCCYIGPSEPPRRPSAQEYLNLLGENDVLKTEKDNVDRNIELITEKILLRLVRCSSRKMSGEEKKKLLSNMLVSLGDGLLRGISLKEYSEASDLLQYNGYKAHPEPLMSTYLAQNAIDKVIKQPYLTEDTKKHLSEVSTLMTARLHEFLYRF